MKLTGTASILKTFQLLLALCFFSGTLCAQRAKKDSLLQLLKASGTDTAQVTLLNALAAELQGNPDSAIACSKKALLLSEKNNFSFGIARSYSNLGLFHFFNGDYPSALRYDSMAVFIWDELLPGTENKALIKKLKARTLGNIATVHYSQGNYTTALDKYFEALKLAEEQTDQNEIARPMGNIGNVYMSQGNYPDALDYYFKALKIKETLGNKREIASTMGNIGIVYFNQADYNKALDYFLRSLKIAEELDDKNIIASWLGNIGSVYNTQKSYSEALEYYEKALKIAEEIGDKKLVTDNLGNIGAIYGVQKEYETSLGYFYKALAVARELGNKNTVAINLGNIGSIYSYMKKYPEAEDYLKKAIALDDSIGALDYQMQFENELSNLYSATGKHALALEHYKNYIAARDSLFNEENTKKTVRLEMNFEFQKKQEADKLKQEQKEALFNEQLKRQRIIGWAGILLFVLILLSIILLFNRHRLKQKNLHQKELAEQQKQAAIAVMDTQERERKRIAEDLHDSLGHLLSTVKLNLQTLPEDQKHYYVNALQLLNQASTEIRNISFDLMPQTLEEEGLIPALHELADKIRKSSLYDIMVMVHDMDNVELDKQMKFNIYRIVQEAVNNILKHADAKEINIQLIRQKDQLTIMIEDDGKGFNALEVKSSGRGMQNINARSQWLHGTIEIDSTPGRGTTITITIPINQLNGN
jgi:two-component system, NarL family, sensor kinase